MKSQTKESKSPPLLQVIQERKLTQNVPSGYYGKQTGKSYGITHPFETCTNKYEIQMNY